MSKFGDLAADDSEAEIRNKVALGSSKVEVFPNGPYLSDIVPIHSDSLGSVRMSKANGPREQSDGQNRHWHSSLSTR